LPPTKKEKHSIKILLGKVLMTQIPGKAIVKMTFQPIRLLQTKKEKYSIKILLDKALMAQIPGKAIVKMTNTDTCT